MSAEAIQAAGAVFASSSLPLTSGSGARLGCRPGRSTLNDARTQRSVCLRWHGRGRGKETQKGIKSAPVTLDLRRAGRRCLAWRTTV